MTTALPEGWEYDALPKVLPAGWCEVGRRAADGASYLSQTGLAVIVSAAVEQDGRRWLHVSLSRRSRLPSWDDLKNVKDVFVGRDRTALQVLPPQARYVNIHPHCLHLWCCLDGDVTPDFTRGSESL